MSIPTFTVVSLEGRPDSRPAVEAIRRTQHCLPYPSEGLLIAPLLIEPFHPGENIRYQTIDLLGPLDCSPKAVLRLNQYFIYLLPKIVATDFTIHVQADGFAVHPQAWTDRFIDYDYIGPPWPIWLSLAMFTLKRLQWPYRVGCGGFSMTSKKWNYACSQLPEPTAGSDIFIHRHRKHFKAYGCRVAPVSLALQWGVEFRLEDHPRWDSWNSFGIHGLKDRTSLWDLGYFAAFVNLYKNHRRNQTLWRASS